MTTTTAFLAQVKAQESWVIYNVDKDNGFEPGYKFKVFGPDGDIDRVCVVDLDGNETAYKPNTDTLKIESTEPNILTIFFMFGKGADSRAFFLRFFFFCEDPTLFRYKIKKLEETPKCECSCPCCRCNPIELLYSLNSNEKTNKSQYEYAIKGNRLAGFDEGSGSGGPH